jgi:hypothetical protein
MSYLAAPIIIPFVKRYSRYRYLMIWIGCKLAGTSSNSLLTHTPQLADHSQPQGLPASWA